MSGRVDLAALKAQLVEGGTGWRDVAPPEFDWDLTDVWYDDVLVLIEAVEAAQALAHQFPHYVWADDMRHLCGADVVRLDQALAKFK